MPDKLEIYQTKIARIVLDLYGFTYDNKISEYRDDPHFSGYVRKEGYVRKDYNGENAERLIVPKRNVVDSLIVSDWCDQIGISLDSFDQSYNVITAIQSEFKDTNN